MSETNAEKKSKFRVVLKVLFLIAYIIFGWTIVIPLIATDIVFKAAFGVRVGKTDKIIDETYYKGLKKIPYTFKSGKNNMNAAMFYYDSDVPCRGVVIVSHGIGCGMMNYLNRAEYFARKGYKAFMFDLTGCCGSEGSGMQGLQQSTLDIKAAICFIRSLTEYKDERLFLYGHSMSGYGAAAVLNDSIAEELTAVATLSGFNYFWDTMFEQGARRVGNMFKLARPFVSLYVFLMFGKVAFYKGIDGINKYNKPVIVVHSKDDPTVLYKFGVICHEDECTNKKAKFVTYMDKGHTLSRPVETEKLIKASLVGKDDMAMDKRNIFQYYIDNRYRFISIDDLYKMDDDFMDMIEKFFDDSAKEEVA